MGATLVILLHAVHCLEMPSSNSCGVNGRLKIDDMLKDRLTSKQKKRSLECHVTTDNFASYCIAYECGFCPKPNKSWMSSLLPSRTRYCLEIPDMTSSNGQLSLLFSTRGCYQDMEFCVLPKTTKAECKRIIKSQMKTAVISKCTSTNAYVSVMQTSHSFSSGLNMAFYDSWANGNDAQVRLLVSKVRPATTAMVPLQTVYEMERFEPIDYAEMAYKPTPVNIVFTGGGCVCRSAADLRQSCCRSRQHPPGADLTPIHVVQQRPVPQVSYSRSSVATCHCDSSNPMSYQQSCCQSSARVHGASSRPQVVLVSESPRPQLRGSPVYVASTDPHKQVSDKSTGKDEEDHVSETFRIILIVGVILLFGGAFYFMAVN